MTFIAVWVLTHLIQTNHVIKEHAKQVYYLSEMMECDLCLGFWVALTVGPSLHLAENRLADRLLSASVVTLVNHLVVAGMKERLIYA